VASPKVPGTARSSSRPSATAAARPSSPTRGRIVFGLVAVAVVGFAALIASLSVREAGSVLSVDDVAGRVVVEGDALIPLLEEGADPALGASAPVVTGADFDGNEVVLGAGGRGQVIVFLASWCPVCERELPEIVRFIEDGGVPEGVELVAVATGLDASRPNWPPQDWYDREGYDGTVIVDDASGTIAQAYGLRGTPYWVVLDANGTVVGRAGGYVETADFPELFGLALAAG
jgi:cytochrome c biogenesis protein CcmG/thiol:disulfide interchange protein DsbE